MRATNKMVYSGTPMIPMPQQSATKRLPPKVVPLKYKIDFGKNKPLILPKTINDQIDLPDTPVESTITSPKLPKISIKHNSFNISNRKLAKFSKFLPKIQNFKPLFHDRNRSYHNVPDIDEEYMSINLEAVYKML